MIRTIALALLLGSHTAAADTPKPQRIVSTNYCTDQLLMRLVEPERIVSLTFLSWRPGETEPEYQSVLDRAKKNHGQAEEILMLEPDLILGGKFSARFSNDLMRKLGKNIVLVEPENTFEEWYGRVREIGNAVGEPERAERMIADFQAELAKARAAIPPGEMPVYADLAVNNTMPGKNTLYAEIINAGGFRTLGQVIGFSGYQTIPLEQLIRHQPDLVSNNGAAIRPPAMATLNLKHPLLRRMAEKAYASIDISGNYTVCTTPATLKVVRQLARARKDVDAAKARGPR